jgi:hypothetical protein
MLKLFFLLQIALFGTYAPVERPQKPLSQLSNIEINTLFQEANHTFKSRALVAELDK